MSPPTLASSTRPAPGRAVVPLVAVFVVAVTLAAAVGRPGAGAQSSAEAEAAGEVVALLELARHEYGEAVEGGRVVNDDEYAEARELTARAAGVLDDLRRGASGPTAARTAARLDSLAAVIERTEPPARYRELAGRTKADLREVWDAVAVPERSRRPSAESGEELYRAACAACHGPGGRGDGRAAAGMDPAPTDLASDERRREASAARDYLVIMYGIPETAMPAARDWLAPDEAWDVVAYLRSLAGLSEAWGEAREPDDAS